MTKISLKPLKKYPWYLRLLFHFQIKKYSKPLEPMLLWGYAPRVLLGFIFMQKALNRKRSPLSPSMRALVSVKVSQINSCAFCVDMNAALLLEREGSEEKLSSLEAYETSPFFSPIEKTALEYAEKLTKSPQDISDELFKRLKEQFSEPAIIELTALIGFQNLSSKFNTALGAEAYGFCKRK